MESRKHEEIESFAYSIYIDEGQPEGRASQHWFEAEKQFEVESQFKAEILCNANMFGSLPC